MSSVSVRKFGLIKWFGGVNNKTGQENNFGFVTLKDGSELYLHRKDWHGSSLPTPLQPITFFTETRGERVSCRRAVPLRGSDCSLAEIYEAVLALPTTQVRTSKDSIPGCAGLRDALTEEFLRRLHASSIQDVQALCAANVGTCSPFRVVSSGVHAITDYELLLDATGTSLIADDVWDHLPRQLITKYAREIATQFAHSASDIVRSKVTPVLEVLPVPLVITLLAREGFADFEIPFSLSARINDYLCAVILGDEAVPDYLVELAGDPRDWNWVPSNPVLQERLDRYHFKKSLAARGTEFLAIYARTPALAGDLEYLILYEIFSLVVAGNAREVVYNVFLQRLWAAMINKQVDLRQQHQALQSLFPSCSVMGPKLSCEAFFWRQDDNKEDMYLCRRKRCYHPKILPDSNHTVTEYTLYDWLNQWGITYENASKPRSRDFPIRIAGYFNRLREIYRRLHCRACSTLMVPHMDYARTSYKWLSNGVVQVQQLAAAYRLTVFHCNDPDCAEHGNNYYINHCIGFNCREIIDSRDLKQKCGAGRYICNNCGSCCQEHGNRTYQTSEARPDTAVVGNRSQSEAVGHSRSNEGVPNVLLAPEISESGHRLPVSAGSVPTLDDILKFAWPDELDH